MGRFRLGREALILVVAVAAAAGYVFWLESDSHNSIDIRRVGRQIDQAVNHRLEHAIARKMLVLGMDAGDWEIIIPMVNRGELPTFSKLIREGTYGRLRSMLKYKSPSLWTTVATGKMPEKHGILDFLSKQLGTYQTVPITNNLRHSAAIWNVLDYFGLRTSIVRWFATWPAEELEHGCMVSQWDAKHSKAALETKYAVYPESLSQELVKYTAVPDAFGIQKLQSVTDFPYDPDYYKKHKSGSPEFQRQNHLYWTIVLYQEDELAARVARYLLKHKNPDFVAAYFRGADGAGHCFWKYYRPINIENNFEVDEEDRAKLRDMIPAYYRFLDQKFAQILAEVDDSWTVVLLSDHGMRAQPDWIWMKFMAYDCNPLLKALGYQEWTPRGDIDWPRTRIGELQFTFTDVRKFYINLEGREKEGIVPLKEYEALRRELAAKLKSMRTISGKPFCYKIDLPKIKDPLTETRHGDIEFLPSSNVRQSDVLDLGEAGRFPVERIAFPPLHSGGHREDGIILFKGPGIKRNYRIRDAHILDVAETMLNLWGLPAAADMDGKSLAPEIVTPEVRDRLVEGTIDTYDVIPRKLPRVDGLEGVDSGVYDMMMERLKALGYIVERAKT